MNSALVLAVILALCGSAVANRRQEFNDFIKTHNKVYSSPQEAQMRLGIFLDNLAVIDRHNSQPNPSYYLGVNQFSDMTFEEFSAQYLMQAPQEGCSATARAMDEVAQAVHDEKKATLLKDKPVAPATRDWRDAGVVTPVKDQGSCGSCWTFSTTGCLESATALATGTLPELAEQQLVDCAQDFDNHGCNGGLPSHAFEYIHYAGGLMSEDDYPYTARDGKCVFDKSKVKATINDQVNITQYDETELKDFIGRLQPVSIAFQVASDFQSYKNGTYTSTVCKSDPSSVNHAVLAVGYGTDDSGMDFYIVKNSWSETWGMDGYFHIEAGKNMCGVATCASFPIVL